MIFCNNFVGINEINMQLFPSFYTIYAQAQSQLYFQVICI